MKAICSKCIYCCKKTTVICPEGGTPDYHCKLDGGKILIDYITGHTHHYYPTTCFSKNNVGQCFDFTRKPTIWEWLRLVGDK